ncbi:MAG: type II toxin-antitoxin system ParD family antitoxin [Chitinophagaceae bacterium]|jgi:antitoxin ParD1/3/4|nr:type II toxin-antitoxin system ParD family antitoxin [Chitinophagaceae bacterium]
MKRNTSVSLGNYFGSFVEKSLSSGRYKNASEVIRAGLRLLEEEENNFRPLKNATLQGIDSRTAKNFDAKKHLKNKHTASNKRYANLSGGQKQRQAQ